MKHARTRKRAKLLSIKSLRNKLDQVFSRYIRKRDADENGMGRCVTCFQWRRLQCGHFIPRQHKSTRWDELNCAGQCAHCNHPLWGGGEQDAFGVAIAAKHGQAVVDNLRRLKHTAVHLTRDDLSAMIERFSKPPKG